MVKNLYSIYDKTASMYSEPKPAPTDGVFTRMVQDMIREGNNQVANHPSDFSIVCVGEWNELSGNTTSAETPRVVLQCDSLTGE